MWRNGPGAQACFFPAPLQLVTLAQGQDLVCLVRFIFCHKELIVRTRAFALIIASFVLFAPSSAQQNPIIDNCCFVNRSCATNQEWVEGWHAFRRNECPSGQPVAPVSAPAGQPIDNCCNVNRQTNQDWVNGWHAFRRNECPTGQSSSAPVSAPAGQPIDNCFCPTLQSGQCAAPRLESIWRNVPYAVFPPGNYPQW